MIQGLPLTFAHLHMANKTLFEQVIVNLPPDK